MYKKDFIEKLHNLVARENLGIYKDLFVNTDIRGVTDPYWKESLKLFKNLTDEEKLIFFKVIKQIGIDTVSNILALLDGVTSLEGQDDEFNLSFMKTNVNLNGDLQDLFLEFDENNR